MATDHAPIAPSSLALTVECPGWIQLASTLPPEPEGPEAAEGTAGHEVALAAVDGFPLALGAVTKNSIRVTQEMIDGAELWASVVPKGATCEEKIERISRIHPTLCYGTPDGFRYFPPGEFSQYPKGKLWGGDYKFGHGYVEAFENYQGMAYMVGLIEKLNLPEDIECEFTIVQPRCYTAEPVRVWRFRGTDLRAMVNIAMQRAQEALGPSPRTIAGAHCMKHHCTARRACKTLQAAGADIIDFIGTSEPGSLEGPALALELMLLQRISKMIEARQTGLEAQAEAMLNKGERIPGVSLERGQSRLTWKPDATIAEVAGLGQFMGLDLVQPQKLITPTQAKAKGLAEAVVNQYAYRPPGAFKLTLDPDNISTRKAFGANKHG